MLPNLKRPITERNSMHSSIPGNLRTAYKEKTLIPIVGAGVSMSLRNKSGERVFPSWKELLEKAATKLITEQKPDLANAIRVVLTVGDHHQAADYARRGLNGGLWNQFFKENFSVKKADIEESSLALPQAIWTLSERVITLNYDRVLRFACPYPDDVHELDNTTKGELADFNRNTVGAPAIWHLHGTIAKPDKIIFTSESYNKLYLDKDSDYQAALETFRALCSTTKLLFVGCGLDDAELLQQLGREHALFAGNAGPHYALVPAAHHAEIQAKLKGLQIELLSFNGFGQPLLDQINAIVGAPKSPLSQAITVSTPLKTIVRKISTTSPPQGAKHIAVLTANPIGENYQYESLLAEFKSLKCEISYFPLNTKALNALNNFNYIFILSKLIKKKIVIEDETLQGRRIGLKDLEECIGNDDTDGVFIFLNHQNADELDTDEIASLSLPTLIFPALEKQKINSFAFKIFKKQDFKYFDNNAIANRDAFKLGELKGEHKDHRTRTALPDLIDPKNTKNYIGRSTDLENICRKIIELLDKNEVLTIKGSGGIGKTITIKKIAVALADRNLFHDGIDFIDCEFVSDYPAFEKKLAANFNLENAIDVKKQIKDNCEKQDKLIILDNVETLLYLDDQQQIKDFIYFICDYATIVITSRELLKLECEQVYELRPFTTDEAYELFTQQLRGRVIEDSERRYIRQNIVEALLDNNPLAIKLIANNIPKGKSFRDLQRELEDDFFRKASDAELANFDRVVDGNIERKKSLYASIHFSYRHLNEAEKMAFELLSLFPDGIDMENLKNIAENRKADQRNTDKKARTKKTSTIITDVIIKALEDKSMTQVDRRNIKLQSIVGKFAEYQLHQRSASDLSHHYQNATAYNIAVANYLAGLSYEDRYFASKIFNDRQSNFFKSIRYIDASNMDDEELLDYLEDLSTLSVATTASGALAQALEKKSNIFSNDETSSRCFEAILCYTRYFSGDFKNAFSQIKKICPLTTLLEFTRQSVTERIITANAVGIYGMEGEELLHLKYSIQMKSSRHCYPSSLFKIGVIDQTLLKRCKTNFFTLEAKYASGLLSIAILDAYIATAYEKDHLNLMQVHYLKAKMGVIDKNRVKKLAIVNPYTKGLQQLMLALVEVDSEKKISLFEQALGNLQHIKYYYVEALFLYARYLREAGRQKRYDEIYQQGLGLACHHYYRWLRYQFEDLPEKKISPYCADDYPLPEALDIDGYIKFLIKEN